MLKKNKNLAYFILGCLILLISINSAVNPIYFTDEDDIITKDSKEILEKMENKRESPIEIESLHCSSSLDTKNAYAIVIGISDYPTSSYDLSYCDDDAQGIYNLLINEYNFKSENVIYLQDSTATKAAINNAFDTINAQITSHDVFFFYYSGHGGESLTSGGPYSYSIDSPHPYSNYYDHTWDIHRSGADYMRVHFDHFDVEYDYDWVLIGDSDLHSGYYYEAYSGYSSGFWSGWIPLLDDDTLSVRLISDNIVTAWGFSIDKYEIMYPDGTQYLCPYDSIPSSPGNYYVDSLIDAKLDAMSASEKYIITDSCNSGGIIPEVQGAGRYIITACADDEYSLEDPALQHGVFTNYFLDSTNLASDSNGDGVRSLEECYSYAYSNTVSYSSSLGYTHHPQQYDGISGEGVLSTAFGGLTLVPTGNSLSYSFTMYGTGLIEELELVVCNNSEGLNYNLVDLTDTPASNTGFGSYSGSLQLDGYTGLTGYGIYAKVSGNRVIVLNETISGDLDSDNLDDALEIMVGSDPELNDTDNDGLTDDLEYNGDTDPTLYDTDGDGMDDGYEVQFGLDPLIDDSNGDLDGDGIINLIEYQIGSNVTNIDSDGDLMPDGWEYNYGLNLTCNDSLDDADADNLTNIEEYNLVTNPQDNDTDNDGLFDGEEVNLYSTSPTLEDSDYDELTDYDEIMIYFTNPLYPDTDGDLIPDGYEVSNNLDPIHDDAGLDYDGDTLSNLLEYQIGSSANDLDTDDDLMPDGYEYYNGLNVLMNDANLDYDNDGLNNLLESQLGSYANDPDSDNDGMPDDWEYAYGLNLMLDNSNIDSDGDGLSDLFEFYYQTCPIDPDTDDDGLNDNQELNTYLTDPCNPDSDGDGWNDGLEVLLLLNPLDPSSSLYTLILNIAGFALIIALSVSISRRIIKNKKSPKIRKKSLINSNEIDENDTQNILRFVKKMKPFPKPIQYRTRPTYQPRVSYTTPRSNQLPSLNDLKFLILYRSPSPKSSYSQEGKRLIEISQNAFLNLNSGRIKEALDGMIFALMSGVPEPMNSRIKIILLDFLNRIDNTKSPTYNVKSSNSKKCSYCGALNPIKNNYCINCGRTLR